MISFVMVNIGSSTFLFRIYKMGFYPGQEIFRQIEMAKIAVGFHLIEESFHLLGSEAGVLQRHALQLAERTSEQLRRQRTERTGGEMELFQRRSSRDSWEDHARLLRAERLGVLHVDLELLGFCNHFCQEVGVYGDN